MESLPPGIVRSCGPPLYRIYKLLFLCLISWSLVENRPIAASSEEPRQLPQRQGSAQRAPKDSSLLNEEPLRKSQEAEEAPIRCGANALYMLIRLSGGEVDFSSILNQLEQRLKGNSLLELRDAAEQLGYSAVIEKDPNLQLDTNRLPAIAFMKAGETASMKTTGHFVVLLSTDSNRITYLDGTTAKLQQVDPSWFKARAPGYLLRLTSHEKLVTIETATLTIVVLLSLWLFRYVFISKPRAC